MSSPLLLDEAPLLVLPSLAVTLGLNEALLLQQIHFWLKIKEKDPARYPKDRRAGADGQEHWWVYNSVRQWQEQFPFWSDNTIQRALTSLKSQGVLLVEHLADDPRDRTNWYTVQYAALGTLTGAVAAPRDHHPKVGQSVAPRRGNALPHSGVMGSPQPGAMHDPTLGQCLRSETSSENSQRTLQKAPAAPGDLTSSFPEKSSDRTSEQTSDKTIPPNTGYTEFKQSPGAQQFAQWRQGKGRTKTERPESAPAEAP